MCCVWRTNESRPDAQHQAACSMLLVIELPRAAAVARHCHERQKSPGFLPRFAVSSLSHLFAMYKTINIHSGVVHAHEPMLINTTDRPSGVDS